MSVMQVTEIMKILPHRYPFLMVDRIVEMDMEAGTVVGIKNLTMNEEFFQGHFPGNPVMPGVLQMEAMAQVAGVMLNSRAGNEGKTAYFMSMNNVKFRKMVIPGDQLRIEVESVRLRTRMATVYGKCVVDGAVVSEAELTFGYGA
ncbi:3-hydroxyacyl-ACP dehydratase FabZ [Pontiella sp.]|uniref:3-hydroxyacyl-ACP dehydratase FabZ n=1 Tax=Pontiella sp. TaxID=2837462 RepID=UPI003564CA14